MTHRCTCGYETSSMDAFVDHVTDAHDALSIAVETLHETPEEIQL